MIDYQYASGAYMKSMVSTSESGLDLVIMLYDGAIEFLMKAVFYMNKKDVARKLHYMDKAIAIIMHLQMTLDMEAGGEVAQSLQKFYQHQLFELTLANIRNDPEKVKIVEKSMRTLREGWRGIKK